MLLVLACLPVLEQGLLAAEEFSPEQLEFFEKEVRPLLIEHCQKCHGAEKQEGGLRVDSRQALLKGGESGAAIVPGHIDEGELIAAVLYDPAGYQMPPAGKLPNDKIELLKKWVLLGAPWPAEELSAEASAREFDLAARAQHWSFQPLQQPAVPTVQQSNWPRHPIDRFILQRLEQAGLQPAAEADRRTLIRRLSFDVLGLPPAPEEVEAFVRDERPDAYEQLIDRYLASPQYGERWGRHWLDVVRYAESRGHEFDYDVPNAWQYRDYVIRALNADLPYDRFLVEQIAGDLLDDETPVQRRVHPETGGNESILGTGFWFLGEWVHSPVDIRQEEADRFDNMIDVYSKAFLGLTVACARCHDHKFDPIRQKDFYALQGFLQSSSYQQVRFETHIQNAKLAREQQEMERLAYAAVSEALLDVSRPHLEHLDSILLAARDYLRSPRRVDESVFDSFESGTYDNWTVEGDAFGSAPYSQATLSEYQGDVGAVGRYFVNSHQRRAGGMGDEHTGKLTSRNFEIQRPYIHFLIGGGNHPGKTCVNLLIDGKVVRTTTGQNSNRMSPATWDVQELQGQTAQIQIVDAETGGWGNIGVDHIRFSHHADPLLPEPPAADDPLLIEIATRDNLSPQQLTEWVVQLQQPDRLSPALRLWSELCSQPDTTAESLKTKLDSTLATTETPTGPQPFSSILTASDDLQIEAAFLPHDLITTGAGYRLVDAETAPFCKVDDALNVRITTSQSLPHLLWDRDWDREQEAPGTQRDPGALSSWERAGRMARTPTFEIASGQIHLLVRGQVNTYVAVDSHILLNGPLHGRIARKQPAQADWQWITHDVSPYQGHRAHLELVPEGEAEFAVAAVVQSPALPKLREQTAFLLNESTQTLSTWAEQLAQQHSRTSSAPVEISAEELEQQLATALRDAYLARAEQPDADLIRELADALPLWLDLESTTAADWTKTLAPWVERRTAFLNSIPQASQVAPAMLDGSAEDEYVFIRGNWKRVGETVPRRFLEVFDGQPIVDTGSGRLQLALEMIDPQRTPIVPRVIANRLWHHYFGRGLCPTPNDFGHLGQLPSHPELLDWLASQLVQENWSLKSIHRHILLSATYRMSSQISTDPRVAEVDPQNVLLHRMHVKRLQGEAIRDGILKVSGRLNSTQFGPSVPIHLTTFLEGRGRPGQSGPVDGHGRRSLYLSVRRNFPEPFFQAFDFPNPHTSIGRRNVSNVPAQALAMLNNPLVVQQSRQWSERLLHEYPDAPLPDRITALYLQAYARLPTAEEIHLAEEFLRSQLEEFKVDLNSPQPWADYCHLLWNSKEFIFIR